MINLQEKIREDKKKIIISIFIKCFNATTQKTHVTESNFITLLQR
jgi:hypothetical protein